MAEVRVWVAQCLCPARHCILANAGEADSEAAARATMEASLRVAIFDALAAGKLNPWCGLCRARANTWTYEVGRTRFRSLAEAKPALASAEGIQAALAVVLGDIPRSD